MTQNQIEEIIKQLSEHEKRIAVLETGSKTSQKSGAKAKIVTTAAGDLVLSIINKIGECEESEEIQTKILDRKSSEGKILLCFYISYKYFQNSWLTTGNIEKITSDLGVKIDISNVTNKIIKLRKYFESGAARKKGQPTPYRINRSGVKRFQELLTVT